MQRNAKNTDGILHHSAKVMHGNLETEIQENLRERTNNPRFGDGQIPDLAKYARTHNY